MLLWRLQGKDATPDKLQCQFENQMNLITSRAENSLGMIEVQNPWTA